MRLPSRLVVTTRNLQRLLGREIRQGMRVVEIGFAPGKQLAYVAKTYGAIVTGVDYSVSGVEIAKNLFSVLGLSGDLLCEDVFDMSIPMGTFDFVYSVGVIEHFDDPRELVSKHIELLKPDGVCLILVPNYRGIYGTLQRYLDPDNLEIHNLNIMTCDAMKKLALSSLSGNVEVTRIDPSQVSWHAKLPGWAAKSVRLALNLFGVIKPVDVEFLCPWIALRITRAKYMGCGAPP